MTSAQRTSMLFELCLTESGINMEKEKVLYLHVDLNLAPANIKSMLFEAC